MYIQCTYVCVHVYTYIHTAFIFDRMYCILCMYKPVNMYVDIKVHVSMYVRMCSTQQRQQTKFV